VAASLQAARAATGWFLLVLSDRIPSWWLFSARKDLKELTIRHSYSRSYFAEIGAHGTPYGRWKSIRIGFVEPLLRNPD